MIGSGSPGNDALIGEVAKEARDRAADMGVYNEELVYSRKCVSLEYRPSIVDEDLESIPLPIPSLPISSRECRRSDTTPYASKKRRRVPDALWWALCCVVILLFVYILSKGNNIESRSALSKNGGSLKE
ncbi:hypothetical protein D0Y65_006166 [Glycine soja]|uniref:Uncharacterized protein n=1 Tax=Glycine soja TaxID=3848 RepID=A0A445L7I4_GLYSO|nr:hypothetical protein D0Y65_006166 [Glycine soja]